jgi:hypothetical protein
MLFLVFAQVWLIVVAEIDVDVVAIVRYDPCQHEDYQRLSCFIFEILSADWTQFGDELYS